MVVLDPPPSLFLYDWHEYLVGLELQVFMVEADRAATKTVNNTLSTHTETTHNTCCRRLHTPNVACSIDRKKKKKTTNLLLWRHRDMQNQMCNGGHESHNEPRERIMSPTWQPYRWRPGKKCIGHWSKHTLVLSQPGSLHYISLCRSKSGPQRVSKNPSHRVLSNTPTSQPTIKVSTAESNVTTMQQTPLTCPSTEAITH